MKQLITSLLTIMILLPSETMAIEIEGVELPQTVQNGQTALQLNGAGLREKFFMDIYFGALYLEQPSQHAETIITSATSKSVVMHFLYSEVDREKLIGGWSEGFEKNQTPAVMQQLRDRLNRFNSMFATAYRGDRIRFDLLGDGTTRITINDEIKGDIPGFDFQQALLAVWLGKNPADKGLKKAMLGHK